MRRASAIAVALLLAPGVAAAQKITKETLTTGGEARTYYLFVPEAAQGKPAPLILMLHGSNRDGRILLEHWQGLAKKEGIILAGPDARQKIEWNTLPDGPHFLHDVVEAVKEKHAIDPMRVYIFGHSAGAIHGMWTGVLESEYFAAVAAHAGSLPQEYAPYIDRAPRKIPIAIWVGTNDRLFPLAAVRATRDLLSSREFPVELTEIKGHTHDYYSRSSEINKAAWAFLQKHQLSAPPKYQVYAIDK